MSRDNQRGIVIPSHSGKSPATIHHQDGSYSAGSTDVQGVQGPVTIYPRGLLPNVKYNVSYQESQASDERLGSDLMAKGITFQKLPEGELIYLNLPMHPGSAVDKTPPTPPPGPSRGPGPTWTTLVWS